MIYIYGAIEINLHRTSYVLSSLAAYRWSNASTTLMSWLTLYPSAKVGGIGQWMNSNSIYRHRAIVNHSNAMRSAFDCALSTWDPQAV